VIFDYRCVVTLDFHRELTRVVVLSDQSQLDSVWQGNGKGAPFTKIEEKNPHILALI
jgi:hypothetical protein